MTGNKVNHNIFYNTAATWPSLYWLSGPGTNGAYTGSSVPPASTTNLYWGPTAGNVPNPTGFGGGGTVTDANPFNANPLFVNPAANNYALTPGSPAFSDIAWPAGDLPTDRGPVNSPFVAAGSTF